MDISRLPQHAAVATELRRRITVGEHPVGTPLPSEAALCAQFAVARGTVRQALGALRAEGMIGGGRGRAPVVRTAAPAQPFETFLSFTRWATQTGRTPGQRTLELARRGASPEVADSLGIDAGEPVVQVVRVRSLDGQPVMVERSTFVEPVGRLLFAVDTDAGSMYEALADAGIDIHAASHTFDAVTAGEGDGALLGVGAGAPLLRERRRATTASGEVVEHGDDRYLPGAVTFTVENTRERAAATWQRRAVG